MKQDGERRDQLMLRLTLALSTGDAAQVQSAHQALVAINESMKAPSIWDYEDLEPCVERLPEAAQNLLRQWIKAVKHDPGADPEAALRAYEAGGGES